MNPLSVKGNQFFEALHRPLPGDVSLVIISHLLSGPQPYLDYLVGCGHLKLLLPKPKSACARARAHYQNQVPVLLKQRSHLTSAERLAAMLNEVAPVGRLVLVDIGGYFSQALPTLSGYLDAELAGIVEVTENGLQRYEAQAVLPVPVYSLARSPLKGPEDYLTGQSIVYSAEALLRDAHFILNGRRAAVFGYGKIGRSIAKALHAKNISTYVVEVDPIRAIEAQSRGFEVISKAQALQRSDAIFCATGNQSLESDDLNRIKNGAFIFSVTSSDDELALDKLDSRFSAHAVSEHLIRYERLGQYFYLANRGNAINFIHNAEVGPYIFLVQGEVLLAIHHLLSGEAFSAGVQALPHSWRQRLAHTWLTCFSE